MSSGAEYYNNDYNNNESLISQQLHHTILSSTDQSQPPTFLANRWGDIKSCNLAFAHLLNDDTTLPSEHPVDTSLLSILSASLSVSIFEHIAQLIRHPESTTNPTRLAGEILVKRVTQASMESKGMASKPIKSKAGSVEGSGKPSTATVVVAIPCQLSLHIWLDEPASLHQFAKQPRLLVGVLSPSSL